LVAAFVGTDFHLTLGVRPMLGPGLVAGDEGRIGPSHAGAALLLGAVAIAATLVPLRRTTGIDPATVLRA